MQWTEAQNAAIGTEGNLIVSAAAGAGKTAVLTERLCRLVEAGTPVDRLLVLTFTRAAAAEMKERIARRLTAAMERAQDEARRAELRRQADAVNTGYICTIDAFCTRILRRHGHAIGLPGSTRVADEMELALLADRTRDALLRDLAGSENADWTALLSAFGSEAAAWEQISETARFLGAQPDPDGWLLQAASKTTDPEHTEELLSTLLFEHRRTVQAEIGRLARCKEALPPAWDKLLSTLDDDLMRLRALLLFSDYDDFRMAVLDFSLMRQPTVKDVPEEDKATVQKARGAAKKAVARIAESMRHSAPEEHALMRRGAAVLESLMRVVQAYRAAFSEAKRKKGVMDFPDVEHFALELLSKETVAAEYRERFLEIAVDEYQDSNGVQEAILSRIRRGGNLFLVGDVKQSIYRFRAAEPGLFLEKLSAFSGAAGSRVDLNENFRSSGEVLCAVNAVFTGVMTGAVGEMDYDARAALVPGLALPYGAAELHLIERGRDEAAGLPSADWAADARDSIAGETGDPGEDADGEGRDDGAEEAMMDAADAEVEARFAAETIRELMENGQLFDGKTGKDRPYRYGDFAILLRSTGQAEIYAQTLAACGIPAYAQSSGGYFDSIEVMVVLSVLGAADNPQQDIPLLAAMRSEIGGFTAAELARIRIARREGAFYEAAFAAAAPDGALTAEDPALSKKCAAFLAFLAHWREESRLIGIGALVARLMDDTGYYDLVGALPGGAQRVRNLDALREKAQQFAAASQGGLPRFLTCMQHAAANVRMGAAQEAGEDMVRILSVHRSKGLEFPAVFLCGAGRQFNISDNKKALRLHGALGMGLRFLDGDGVRCDTAGYRAIAARQKLEQLSEEMRVLYVALTRAKTRLYVTASVRGAKEALASAETVLSEAAVAASRSALPWLLHAVGRGLAPVVHAREEFLSPLRPPEAVRTEESGAAIQAAAQARFAWRYPYGEAVALPAKQAVSDLSRRRAYVFAPPVFLGGEEPSAASRGTATHALLETMPLRAMDEGEVERLLTPLRARYPAATAVRAGDIAAFTQSPIFRRLMRSETVRRELPFGWETPMELLRALAEGGTETNEDQSGETVLLQGVIDCCFLEDGAWVLLDYKTDRPETGVPAEAHAARYRTQLALYSRALAALTGVPVRERYVVLLRMGAAVPV